jgi:hypothetical protein
MSDSVKGYTKNEIISNVQNSIGNTSTSMRNYLRTKFHWLESFICGKTDWSFLHQTLSFNTVASTQSYGLTVANVGYDADDVELVYDSTNGREIHPSNIRIFDKVDPKGDDEGEPTNYAFWEHRTIYFYKIPNDAFAIKVRAKVRPTFSTAWADSEYPVVSRDYQGVLQQGLEAIGKKYSKHSDWKEDWFLFKDALNEAIADEVDKLQGIDRIKDPREENSATSEYNDLNDEIWRNF